MLNQMVMSDFFEELSKNEQQFLWGGFDLKNNTGDEFNFCSFGGELPCSQQTLADGDTGQFAGAGEYVVFNSYPPGTIYAPKLKKLKEGGAYKAVVKNGRNQIIGGLTF
jgi:hypothetical protein